MSFAELNAVGGWSDPLADLRCVPQLWLRDSSGFWKQHTADSLTVQSSSLAAAYHQHHVAHRYRQLIDFDDHLNDISK